MAETSRDNGIGGGVFIAFGPFIGLALGWILGQPTIGLLVGLAVGIFLAIAIWLATRSRHND
ncbi:hypothetical protein HFP51_01475 [Parasphingopyxis sp. CP4]|uniref:hypothetical protein n=1 Tax=Parasphingopyxis sp. CP4 TaxID=2724527 RepID=UPI00159FD854|nr:hypothetical protein [Parasphingopyxis sp. CP4]QLC20971.1 hypothetical protein HFP51_01475 [Parasphingopyxis sp. CP4]